MDSLANQKPEHFARHNEANKRLMAKRKTPSDASRPSASRTVDVSSDLDMCNILLEKKLKLAATFCQTFIPLSKDINTCCTPKMMSNRKERARKRNPNKQNPVSCLHPNNKLQFSDVFRTLSRCSHSIAK